MILSERIFRILSRKVLDLVRLVPQSIRQRLAWSRPLKLIYVKLSQAAGMQGEYDHGAYHSWIKKYDAMNLESLRALDDHLGFWILLDMALFNRQQLSQTLCSLERQRYRNFKITLIGMKRSELEDIFPAIKHLETIPDISELSIEDTCHYVIFPGHSGCFSINALSEFAISLREPKNHILYSDHDHLSATKQRMKPCFKPDLNPDMIMSTDYTKDLVALPIKVFNASLKLAKRLNVPPTGRIINHLSLLETASECVQHVPKVLFNHYSQTQQAAKSGNYSDCLGSYLAHKYPFVETQWDHELGAMRIKWPLPHPAPLVSIIIPTKNHRALVEQCVCSIYEKTDYPSYEILLVENQSDDLKAKSYFETLVKQEKVRLFSFEKPFNYSSINNYAVAQARGEILAFLNNDIEVISPEWLSEMVSQACRPEIGCVGAKLLYPDGSIQHGGVVIGYGGVAGHAHKLLKRDSNGYMNRLMLVQNFSAVTAACMVMRKSVFNEVGGFNEDLAVAFNDVDLCLCVREAGYRNLWTPHSELYHHESASRGQDLSTSKRARFECEIAYMKATWKTDRFNDPAYNPNLSLSREDFAVRE